MERIILYVTLESLDGRRWSGVGGGDTVEDAIAFAVQAAPDDVRWHVAAWNDLFGD